MSAANSSLRVSRVHGCRFHASSNLTLGPIICRSSLLMHRIQHLQVTEAQTCFPPKPGGNQRSLGEPYGLHSSVSNRCDRCDTYRNPEKSWVFSLKGPPYTAELIVCAAACLQSSAVIACQVLGFNGGAFRDITSIPANVTLRQRPAASRSTSSAPPPPHLHQVSLSRCQRQNMIWLVTNLHDVPRKWCVYILQQLQSATDQLSCNIADAVILRTIAWKAFHTNQTPHESSHARNRRGHGAPWRHVWPVRSLWMDGYGTHPCSLGCNAAQIASMCLMP